MRSEADADTTGTTLDRQKEKVQMNLPQRRPAVLCLPFSNEECCGHCKACLLYTSDAADEVDVV